jgi:hypothetical protein
MSCVLKTGQLVQSKEEWMDGACEWQRRTFGTRSMFAQREEAALPKRQTFDVM